METCEGWLLQSYIHADGGLTVWLIDVEGERRKFHINMQVSFYAAGDFSRLRQLWRFLKASSICCSLSREEEKDLYLGSVDVMEIKTDIADQKKLFHLILNEFPDLDYYNADIQPSLHLTAQQGVFPLAHCHLDIRGESILDISTTDDPWEIEYAMPPLKLLFIEPDCDPFYQTPSSIKVKADKPYRIDVSPLDTFLKRVNAVINRFDPDMIVTAYGDAWLFPFLFAYCKDQGITHFNPCRDKEMAPLVKEPLSYHTYGQILFRDSQTYLFGRLHIDTKNLTQIYASGLVGIFEQSRITGMPIQDGARRSPGAGFSAMQVIKALSEDVLVPFRKAQAEHPKSARQLLNADQGGLIGQPKLGVHYGAIEFDFISMYPAIMTRFNLSPETVFKQGDETAYVPQLGYSVDMSTYGLIPKTLQPLVKKRIALKALLKNLDPRDCRYQALKQQNNAQKSLQTVSFGYMGHKHFKYTQIEVHESITAYSRDAMLLTKELLEEAGYEIIHIYVDGIYFKRDEPTTKQDFDQLLEQIHEITGLPMGNEGMYKWIIFLPSREDPRASVPNRYFGVFADGEIKIRGVEARTRDTPPLIKEAQMAVIEVMAAIPFGEKLEGCLPRAMGVFKEYVEKLRDGRAKISSLLITQVLTRDVADYKANTRVARAARQLEADGKRLNKGMRIKYLLSRDKVGVIAWRLDAEITFESVDVPLYLDRLISAGHTVFQSFGITKKDLRDYALYDTVQLNLPFVQDIAEQLPARVCSKQR